MLDVYSSQNIKLQKIYPSVINADAAHSVINCFAVLIINPLHVGPCWRAGDRATVLDDREQQGEVTG